MLSIGGSCRYWLYMHIKGKTAVGTEIPFDFFLATARRKRRRLERQMVARNERQGLIDLGKFADHMPGKVQFWVILQNATTL